MILRRKAAVYANIRKAPAGFESCPDPHREQSEL